MPTSATKGTSQSAAHGWNDAAVQSATHSPTSAAAATTGRGR